MKANTLIITCTLIIAASAAVGAATAQGNSASFTFNDQNSGGHTVVIENANLPDGGFMTVHDSTLLTKADPLGSVVGVSDYLSPGAHSQVRIYLTRALSGSNETLIAMPHKDSNGNHLYDFVSSSGKDDGPYTGGPQGLAGLTGPLAGFNGISATPKTVNNTAYVTMSPQSQAGNSLIVDLVDCSEPCFVAVHDASLVSDPANNVFSSVVGVSAALPAGVSRDVVVPLTFNASRLNNTGTLIPMVHKDSNRNGVYDFVSSAGKDDGPFLGQGGNLNTIVYDAKTVTYSGGARTEFLPQATGGHVVLVPEAFLPEGGFVAIHDSTLLSNADPLKSVRGVSEYLTPGIHRNVTVELSTQNTGAPNGALSQSDTLIAMPHKDTNGNHKYDFVTSAGADDGPYTGGPNALSGLSGDLAGFNGISSVPANATLAAGVLIVENQYSTDGRSIKIAYADLSSAGFIALHDESLLADVGANVLTSVVGVSDVLQPGLHRDITIAAGNNCAGCVKTHALNTSQTLIAMPHKDSNGNGKYDFITSAGKDDGPFTGASGNGNVVTASNIVVSVGRYTTPVTGAALVTPPSGSTSTTTTTTSTTAPPTGGTTPPSGQASTPGFEFVALAGALVLAMIVLRRKA